MIKTMALVFLTLVSLVLGGMLLQEKHRATEQLVRVADLQSQVAHQHEEIQKASAATAELEQKRVQLVARNKATKQALLDAQSTPEPTPAVVADAASARADGEARKKKPSNPFAGSIAKMMKDPAMKEMMRATQGTALKQMYGDLVKQWSLSPEETQTFYDLLLDKQMDQMDKGMKLLEKGPEAAGTATTSAADLDAKIKASLGDDLYKQYQDYGKTIGGRLAVSQFQQQLAASNAPAMTPDQSATLLQTVTEETAHVSPGSYPSPAGPKGDSFTMDPAQTSHFLKGQADLNERVDARMANTLSADQLRVLKEQQQQMLAMQKMGMEMAEKMMGPSPTP